VKVPLFFVDPSGVAGKMALFIIRRAKPANGLRVAKMSSAASDHANESVKANN
jgi:hypothetical protein